MQTPDLHLHSNSRRYVQGLRGGAASHAVAKLPGWIKPSVEVLGDGKFGPAFARLVSFFKDTGQAWATKGSAEPQTDGSAAVKG